MLFGAPFWYKKNVEFRVGIHLGSFARFLLLTMASRAPKRSPTELQNFLKTIFGSKTLIFQKCKDFYSKTIIFEAWRGSSGAQNRLQEVPKRNKKAYRRSGPTARSQTRVACLLAATCQTRVACLPAARCQTRVARKLPRGRRGSVFGSFWVLPKAF